MEKVYEFKKGEEVDSESLKGGLILWYGFVGDDYDYDFWDDKCPLTILRPFTITITLTHPEGDLNNQ